MRRRLQAGMTLLETLIGLIILAMIATLSLLLVDGANRLFAQGDRMDRRVQDASVSAFLKNQLSSASTIVDRVVDGAPILFFTGRGNELVFVSSLPLAAEIPEMQITRLFLDGSNLVVERKPLWTDAAPRRRVLVENVGSLEFVYWGPGSRGLAAVHDWEARSQLPTLIEMRVTGMAPDTRLLLEIAAQPALSPA